MKGNGKGKKLTPKQSKFVIEYIKTGNGAEAARRSYDSPKNADVIAAQALQKPVIIEAINNILDKSGLKLDDIAAKLTKSIDAGIGIKATNADSLRGLEIALKLHNAFPAHRSIQARVDLSERYKEMAYPELVKELQAQRQLTEALLAE